MNKAFRIEIKSSDDNQRHVVDVVSALGKGAILVKGNGDAARVLSSLNVNARHRAATLNLIASGACGGNFDF